MEDYGGNSTAHYHHRHGVGGGAGGGGSVGAPFVLKTYRMVDDPSTDTFIGWGHDNNSFVIVDSFAFSQTLLPSYFKHSNFSSFVRQLNTYGFRKVDPNRWEFAHLSFLRGQTHLLRLVVRRNSGYSGKKKEEGWEEEEEEDEKVAAEVVRLKQEQRRIEERMEGMWTRVQETERPPRQMMAFLVKVAGDSKLLDHLPCPVTDAIEGGKKRARLCSGTEEGDFAGGRNQFGAWAGIQDGEEAHEAYIGTSVDPVVVGRVPTKMDIVGRGPIAFPLSFPAENGF